MYLTGRSNDQCLFDREIADHTGTSLRLPKIRSDDSLDQFDQLPALIVRHRHHRRRRVELGFADTSQWGLWSLQLLDRLSTSSRMDERHSHDSVSPRFAGQVASVASAISRHHLATLNFPSTADHCARRCTDHIATLPLIVAPDDLAHRPPSSANRESAFAGPSMMRRQPGTHSQEPAQTKQHKRPTAMLKCVGL